MNAVEAALLVVDDNENNRYTLTRRLKREGYTNLTTANDGRQGLELLRSKKFDLVLLDIMMPELDGYQVLEQVKADAALRDIPVIMISALEEVESVIRCVELGAEDYLAKPFNATLLRARVGTSLEKKRLRDEVRASLHRLEQELDAARVLQLGMLPTTFPSWSQEKPVEVHALMEPAREVGGDLYDFFYASDTTFCFLVGDVSGKGAPAAMFMARTRSLVRMAIELWQRLASEKSLPGQIAEVVNRELCQNNRECMFVTLFLGFFNTQSGVLVYTNAGHPAPYVLRDGDTERIDGKPDAPLGVRRNTAYRSGTVTLQPGDAVFVCTDGVAEAMNASDEFYTDERLHADMRSACAAAPAEIIRMVKEHLDTFSGCAPKADDVTMLALRWQPRSVDASEDPVMPRMTSAGRTMGGISTPTAVSQTTDLVIRNGIAELAHLSAALERIGAENAIAPKPLMQLQVVLDEMVSNVIKYAWPEGGVHDIQIRITVGLNEVKVEVVDDGRMFNPLHAPALEKLQPGQKLQPGGVGIHMVKQLVDSVEFARIEDRNHLTLIKRCAIGLPPH